MEKGLIDNLKKVLFFKFIVYLICYIFMVQSCGWMILPLQAPRYYSSKHISLTEKGQGILSDILEALRNVMNPSLPSEVYAASLIAIVNASPNPGAVDKEILFDASASYHQAQFHNIIAYQWDFDISDGLDWDNPDATGPVTTCTYSHLGDYTVTLRILDDNIPPEMDTDIVLISITMPPHPPTANANGPYITSTGEFIILDGSGSFDIDEPDGDIITTYGWETDMVSPWDFDDATGLCPTIPGFDMEGTYPIGLRVADDTENIFPGSPNLTDNDFTEAIVYNQCIIDLYVRPKGTKASLIWTHLGDTYEYQIYRSEMGPNIGFELIGTTISNYSTFIDYNVELYKDYWYRVQAEYDNEICASFAYHINSQGRTRNNPPEIISIPPLNAQAGELYIYDAEAQDPDGDAITYLLDQGPDGMTIDNNTGLIEWTPIFSQAGDNYVKVRTEDSRGASSTQFFTIIVNIAPVALITAEPTEGTVPLTVQLNGTGSIDPDGWIVMYEWDFEYDGVTFTADASGPALHIIEHVYEQEGTYTAALRVTDDGVPGLISITTIGVEVETGFVDNDGDGMDDNWELANALNPTNPEDRDLDPDNDSLTNFQEYTTGTNPHNPDTDGDGLLDGVEVASGTNPLVSDPADIDSDGIPNDQDNDNDNDTLPDLWEAINSLNPLDPSDANKDSDGDFLVNLYEYANGGHPQNPDTDSDGVLDGYDEKPADPSIILSKEFRTLEHIAGTGAIGISGDGGPAQEASLGSPQGMCMAGSRIYIADSAHNAIRVIDLIKGTIKTLAGSAGAAGYTGDSRDVSEALLNGPHDVAVHDNVCCVADTNNHRIRAINLSTEPKTIFTVSLAPHEIKTIAGTGTAGYNETDTIALEALLNSPKGLAFDTAGNLYFADSGNNMIRKISSSGTIFRITGHHAALSGYAGEGADPLDAYLNAPSGITIHNGDLYIADTGNHAVRKVNFAKNNISTIAGTPQTAGRSGDGGPVLDACLDTPQDIAFDLEGKIHIACRRTVRTLSTDKRITRTAGNPFSGTDTSPLTLSMQGGAVMVYLNDLYFADTGTGRIFRIPFDITDVISKKGGLYQGAQPGPANTEGDLPADESCIQAPDITIDPSDQTTVYIDAFTKTLRTISSEQTIENITFAGQFQNPDQIERIEKPDGIIYILSDTEAYKIYALNKTPSEYTVFGRTIPPGASAVIAGNGSDTPGPFFNGPGIPISSDALTVGLQTHSISYGRSGGNDALYIASHTAENELVILKLDHAGMIEPAAGGGSIEGYNNPALLEARLGTKLIICAGSPETVFGADPDTHVLIKFDLSGNAVTLIAGEYGIAGYEDEPASAAEAHLSAPCSLAYQNGILYIADSGNYRVRAVDLSQGTVKDITGTGTCAMTNPGIARESFVSGMLALYADTETLLISDLLNRCILEVSTIQDSDNDGLADIVELHAGTDPWKEDSDGDSISDKEELIQRGTDPSHSDSDRDGVSDSDEINGDSNPNDAEDNTPDTTAVPPEIIYIDFDGYSIHTGERPVYKEHLTKTDFDLEIRVKNPRSAVSLFGGSSKLYLPYTGVNRWQETTTYDTKTVTCKVKLPQDFYDKDILTAAYSLRIIASFDDEDGKACTRSFAFAVKKSVPVTLPATVPQTQLTDPNGGFSVVVGDKGFHYGYNSDFHMYSGYFWSISTNDENNASQQYYIRSNNVPQDSDYKGSITITGLPGSPSSLTYETAYTVDQQAPEPLILDSNDIWYSAHVEVLYNPIAEDQKFWVSAVNNLYDREHEAGTCNVSAAMFNGTAQTKFKYWFGGIRCDYPYRHTYVPSIMACSFQNVSGSSNEGIHHLTLAFSVKDHLYYSLAQAGSSTQVPQAILYNPIHEQSFSIPVTDSSELSPIKYMGTATGIHLNEGLNTLILAVKNAGGDVYAHSIRVIVEDESITGAYADVVIDSQYTEHMRFSCVMTLLDKAPQSFDVQIESFNTLGPDGCSFTVSDTVDQGSLIGNVYAYPLPRGVLKNNFPASTAGDPQAEDGYAATLVYGYGHDWYTVSSPKLGSMKSDPDYYRGRIDMVQDGTRSFTRVIVPGNTYSVHLIPATDDPNIPPTSAYIACDEASHATSALPDQASDRAKSVLKLDLTDSISAGFQVRHSEDDGASGTPFLAVRPGAEIYAYRGSSDYGALHYTDSHRYTTVELIDRSTDANNIEYAQPVPSGISPSCGINVLARTGEFVEQVTDLIIPGRGMDFALVRTYCSQNYSRSILGNNWDFNYNKRLYIDAYHGNGTDVYYYNGYGREYRFTNPSSDPNKPGFLAYESPKGLFLKLQRNPDHSFTLKTPSGIKYEFPSSFNGDRFFLRIAKIRDLNSNEISFEYNEKGRLILILDTLNRNIDFYYNTEGNLSLVKDFGGRCIRYTYYKAGYDTEDHKDLGCEGDLASASFLGTETKSMNRKTSYEYETKGNRFQKHNLKKIKAHKSKTQKTTDMLENIYDEQDRVIRQETPDAKDKAITYTYKENSTTVTDRNKIAVVYTFKTGDECNLLEFITEKQVEVASAKEDLITLFAYNTENLMLSQVTTADGRTTEYEYVQNQTDPRRLGDIKKIILTPGTPDTGVTNPFPSLDQQFTYNYEDANNTDDFTRIVSYTTPRGNTFRDKFDDRGNHIKTLPPVCDGGAAVQWTETKYNTRGQPVLITTLTGPDPNGPGTKTSETIISYFPSDFSFAQENIPLQFESGANVTETGEDSQGSYQGKTEVIQYLAGEIADPNQYLAEEIEDPNHIITHTDLNAYGYTVRRYDPYEQDVNINLNPAMETLSTSYDIKHNNRLLYTKTITNTINDYGETTGMHTKYLSNLDTQAPEQVDNPEIDGNISITTQYTASGRRLTSQLSGVGEYEHIIHTYGPEGELISQHQPGRAPTTFEYTARYQIKTSTEGDTYTRRTYNSAGKIKTIADTDNNIIRYLYDGYQRLRTIIYPSGREEYFTYDEDGNETGHMIKGTGSSNDLTRTTAYDNVNRVSAISLKSNTAEDTTSFSYNNYTTVITDDFGNKTTETYDGLDRLIKRRYPSGDTVEFKYDLKSQIIKEIETDYLDSNTILDPNTIMYPNTIEGIYLTENTYNSIGNLIQTKTYKQGEEADARITKYQYDTQGNVLLIIDPKGNKVAIQVDEAHRTKKVKRWWAEKGKWVITRTELDDHGNVTALYDANGNKTSFGYDIRNRITHMENPDHTNRSYTYNSNNLLYALTTENGSVVTHTYDKDHRLTGRSISWGTEVDGTTQEDYVYDSMGRLESAKDNNGSTLVCRRFSYDRMSRINEDKQDIGVGDSSSSYLTEFTHDDDGAVNSMTYPGGGTLTYARDSLRRVTGVHGEKFFSLPDTPKKIIDYTYAGRSRIWTRSTYHAGSEIFHEQFGYTNHREIKDLDYSFNQYPDQSHGFSYQYDKVSNIIHKEVKHLARTKNYTYDSLYRLTDYTSPSENESVSWGLDDAGNRLEETQNDKTLKGTVNSMNEYLHYAGYAYWHTTDGNLKETGKGDLFTYDYKGRMATSFTKQRVNYINSDNLYPAEAQYLYDTDNIRVKSIINGHEIEYVTSGGRVLEEYEWYDIDGNAPESDIKHLKARYVYGNGIDEVVAMERDLNEDDNFSEDECFYYLRDAQGNITGLTDHKGEILEQYEYSPFGKVKIFDKNGNRLFNPETGAPMVMSNYENPYLFQGRRYDPWSGLYYFRNRYYDPETGRFLTRDPERDDALGNLYAFVNNNPVTGSDPWGLEAGLVEGFVTRIKRFFEPGIKTVRTFLSGNIFTSEHGKSNMAIYALRTEIQAAIRVAKDFYIDFYFATEKGSSRKLYAKQTAGNLDKILGKDLHKKAINKIEKETSVSAVGSGLAFRWETEKAISYLLGEARYGEIVDMFKIAVGQERKIRENVSFQWELDYFKISQPEKSKEQFATFKESFLGASLALNMTGVKTDWSFRIGWAGATEEEQKGLKPFNWGFDWETRINRNWSLLYGFNEDLIDEGLTWLGYFGIKRGEQTELEPGLYAETSYFGLGVLQEEERSRFYLNFGRRF